MVGTVDQLPELSRSHGVEGILIAVPAASPEQRNRVLDHCRAGGLPFKTVPALSDILQGKARIGQLREARPETLLGREAIKLNMKTLRNDLRGKRILVTGAAGSIGSELCRQLADLEPEILVLFDRAESPLYFGDLELRNLHSTLKVVPIIGDILNRQLVEEVIRACAPDVLCAAAAYKPVPLMEYHPLEGIGNNIFGTEAVAVAARDAGVTKFIVISSDKAVNPVGIMGMTKRMAECLLRT